MRITLRALPIAAGISVIVYGPWASAQVRAVAVLATVLRIRVLGWATRVVTGEPRAEESVLAGVPTSVVRPGRRTRWPVLVFVNGVTARGRHHPDVQRLAAGLARAGFLVLVPDPPGLAGGEITEETLAGVAGVARAAADRPDADGGRVGLVGVSIGATLALAAAADASLAERVTVVAGIAPYTDLANDIRLATTGYSLDEGRLVPHETGSFLALVVARTLVAVLPPSHDRNALLAELRRLPDDTDDPLDVFRARRPEQVAPSARALVELLGNRDPRRFEQLYAALSPELRARIERLSPLAGAGRLRAPVEIASAADDKYVPLGETRALARAATHTRVRLAVTSTLDHASRSPESPTSFASTAGSSGPCARRAAREPGRPSAPHQARLRLG